MADEILREPAAIDDLKHVWMEDGEAFPGRRRISGDVERSEDVRMEHVEHRIGNVWYRVADDVEQVPEQYAGPRR